MEYENLDADFCGLVGMSLVRDHFEMESIACMDGDEMCPCRGDDEDMMTEPQDLANLMEIDGQSTCSTSVDDVMDDLCSRDSDAIILCANTNTSLEWWWWCKWGDERCNVQTNDEKVAKNCNDSFGGGGAAHWEEERLANILFEHSYSRQ